VLLLQRFTLQTPLESSSSSSSKAGHLRSW
jgi:hypothetical protein